MQNIRDQFPIFTHNPDLVYLDNSSTNQRPQSVIDAITDYYSKYNANVHRGVYQISERATEAYEGTRESLAKFINADPKEIVFTGGVTDSLNGLAHSLSISGMLGANPRIVTTPLEHHSNILPWQALNPQSIHYLEVDNDYQVVLDTDDPRLADADLFTIQYSSNVTGTTNNLEELVAFAKSSMPNALIVIDAAQALSHLPIDVKKTGVDFMVLSAHKAYGPTGAGALYGKLQHLERMEPFKRGGGMITEVHKEHASWAEVPTKFEAGTPNIAQVIGFGAAIDFISSLGLAAIRAHEQELTRYALEKLQEIPDITLFHPRKTVETSPVVAFTIGGAHPHDVAQLTAEDNIALRAGHHCCQLLHRDIFGVSATNRISMAVFNTKGDIDKAVESIQKAVTILKP